MLVAHTRSCDVGLMLGQPAPLHFPVGPERIDRDCQADFGALGLLEAQPGKCLSSIFRM